MSPRKSLLPTLFSLVAIIGLATQAHAIVWCHDYSLWEASGRKANENERSPDDLRARLKKMNFDPVMTLAPFTPGADARLKPGDVIIWGNSHSGFVNPQGRINHFAMTQGQPHRVRSPEDAMGQPNYRRGQTLVDVWSFERQGSGTNVMRPYRNETAQVWRRGGDLRVTVTWDTRTDVDLWVIEPDGAKCYFGNKQTPAGGHLFQDVTTGFGPEEYQMHKAPQGEFAVKVHLYSRPANVTGATRVTITVTRNAGTPQEASQTYRATLTNRGDLVEVCRVKF